MVSSHPNLTLLQNPHNTGFAAACNQGLAQATQKWTLFLNPDVMLTEQNLTDLLEHATTNNLSAVSVVPDSADYAKPVPTLLSLLSEFTPLKKILPLSLFSQKTLTGGILLCNTADLKKLGGWDERFFLWFEDSDLTKRFLDAGLNIGFCHTKVQHLGGYSVKKLTDQLQKDLFFNAMRAYANKHFSTVEQALINLIALKYTKKKTLPVMNPELNSIIIPNKKAQHLEKLFAKPRTHQQKTQETIIVSSDLSSKQLWQYRTTYPHIRFIQTKPGLSTTDLVQIGKNVATGVRRDIDISFV